MISKYMRILNNFPIVSKEEKQGIKIGCKTDLIKHRETYFH